MVLVGKSTSTFFLYKNRKQVNFPLKEVIKEIVRAVSVHLFQKTILDKEKTTRRWVLTPIS